jgi:hypothetical protein
LHPNRASHRPDNHGRNPLIKGESLFRQTRPPLLKTQTSVEEIFRRAQKVFNAWAILPPEERTAASILKALDFDFFELLDAVTIARSRKHIETFYDTKDILAHGQVLSRGSQSSSLESHKGAVQEVSQDAWERRLFGDQKNEGATNRAKSGQYLLVG